MRTLFIIGAVGFSYWFGLVRSFAYGHDLMGRLLVGAVWTVGWVAAGVLALFIAADISDARLLRRWREDRW